METLPLLCDKAPDVEALKRYKIQLLDARCLAGREHLEFAVEQAKKAFERRENISSDFLIEVLVRASATRQIKVALERLGIGDSREVIAIAEEVPRDFLERYSCRVCEEVLEVTEEKYKRLKEIYGITEAEIQTLAGASFESRVHVLKELIKERIALIAAE
jgi:tRNA threonylcarbamoyladenosine modification (KEOPS) complex Cgi121 subunit